MADDLRGDLAQLVRELLAESESGGEEAGPPVGPTLRAHLGENARELPVLTETLADWELPNLQLGLEALLAQPGWSAETAGLTGRAKRYEQFSLSDLMTDEKYLPRIGPPEYVNAEVGPGETMPCLEFALLLLSSPRGPSVLFVRRGQSHFGQPQLALQAVAAAEGAAASLFAELRRLMQERDVYRGQVLSIAVEAHTGASRLVFMERPQLDSGELVLPDGVLDRIERHVLGPTRHREALLAGGRHLSRGLLLWGPPGTGKTLTLRYLAGLLTDATVVILSGGSLGYVGAFAGLAKRLAPSLVVLEDVDLVAGERTFGPFGGSSPVLFELMNEMDGIGEDADVAWVLTTNRPDALEPALAARPGRIDLAVELPMPDAAARSRLLELYGRGLDLRLRDRDAVVRRTEGAPASFFKELLRKAALAAAEAERTTVADEDVAGVLDELLAETGKLTRVLLGAEAPSGSAVPGPHAWMEAYPAETSTTFIERLEG